MAVVHVYPTIHNKFMLLSFEHRRRRHLQMLSDSVNYREKRLYVDRSLPPPPQPDPFCPPSETSGFNDISTTKRK